jgi:hypothetical protein
MGDERENVLAVITNTLGLDLIQGSKRDGLHGRSYDLSRQCVHYRKNWSRPGLPAYFQRDDLEFKSDSLFGTDLTTRLWLEEGKLVSASLVFKPEQTPAPALPIGQTSLDRIKGLVETQYGELLPGPPRGLEGRRSGDCWSVLKGRFAIIVSKDAVRAIDISFMNWLYNLPKVAEEESRRGKGIY